MFEEPDVENFAFGGDVSSMDNYVGMWAVYEAEGVNVVAGPNKEADKAKICQGTAGDSSAEARKIACQHITYMNNLATLPVKSSKVYSQIALANRF